jgi:hypothetical protein
MKRTHRPFTPALTGFAVVLLTAGLLVTFPQPGHAGKGGAFVGGLIGGHVLTNMSNRSERRTRAEEYNAYSRQPAPAPAPAPAAAAPSSQTSVQSRLDTLDRLAANGTITKEEYQQRRKAILDGI